jgi:hypothetical protein
MTPESSKTDSKTIIISERLRILREEGTGSEKEENEKGKQSMSFQSDRNGQNFYGVLRKYLDELTNKMLKASLIADILINSNDIVFIGLIA